MPEAPQLPPPDKMIRELRTPDFTVGYFRELVSRESARFQELSPIKRGTLYSSCKGADVRVSDLFPQLYFLSETVPIGSNTVAGMTQSTYVIWNWASAPDAESPTNAEISYLGDATGNPVYAREYTIKRDVYECAPFISTGSPLTALLGVKVIQGGQGYTTAEADFGTTGAGICAEVQFVIADGVIIEAIVTKEGVGFTSASTITVIGDGSGAEVRPIIQPVAAILTSQKKVEFADGDPLSNEFVKVLRVYETLPGPWVPFTRYDNDLGPIQGRRRAVLNTGQRGGVFTQTTRRNYEGRDGSSVVLLEIEENLSNGTGIPGPIGEPNPAFPLNRADTYTDERGAVDRTTQLVLIAADEETQEATLTRSGGIVTKTQYQEFDEFHMKKVVEMWVEVIVNDQAVTSEFGGGILDVTERRDQPGAQVPDSGFLVVSSKLRTTSPDEQTKFSEILSPDSNISNIELLDGGSGYATAPAVTFVGGTGSGAAATAVLGYAVASVTVTASGSNYAFPPLVRFANGGGGGGFAVSVLGFGITSITVDNGGQDYASVPTVIIGGDGTGAAATAVLGYGVRFVTVTNPGTACTDVPGVAFDGDGVGAAADVIVGHPIGSATITNAGTGYTSTPSVAVSGGGTGGAAVAVVARGIDVINVTAGGAGYTTPPAVVIAAPTTGGVQATATAILTAGAVTSIVVDTPGDGYPTVPAVSFSGGGGGAGAAATAVLNSNSTIARVVITAGGIYETTPILAIIGGGGSGATADAALDESIMFVNRIQVTNPGSGYTVAPTVRFVGNFCGPLAATSTLLSAGSVKSITMTSFGAAYTVANVTFSGGGGGFGAAATANFDIVGKVLRVDVVTGGLYKTVPTVEFVGGDPGSGAAATAVLAATGSVVELLVSSLGTYTVAPTVVFTPAGASAVYNLGSLLWPSLPGFHVDEITGILVNFVKTVVPKGTPYPGRSGYRGPFIEMQTYDRWKSIQIVSAIDLNTLPLEEAWNTTHPFNLPPRLLSIEVVWTTNVSKNVATGISNNGGQAHADVSSGANGGVIVRSSAGYRGYARAVVARNYFYGSPLLSAIPKPFIITPVSGSIVLAATNSKTGITRFDDGGNSFGDEFNSQIHATDTRDFLVGSFQVISTDVIRGQQFVSSSQVAQGGNDVFITHYSQPQSAIAVSPGGRTVGVFAGGTPSTMKISIPQSTPPNFVSGQQILMEVNIREWRFGVWVVDRIYVTVP